MIYFLSAVLFDTILNTHYIRNRRNVQVSDIIYRLNDIICT